MKKCVLALTLTVTSVVAIATDTGVSDDIRAARSSNNWADQFNRQPDQRNNTTRTTNANTEIEPDVTTAGQVMCTREKQTSIPKSVLELDFLSQRLKPSHDPLTGKLVLDGGMIKGNCLNMLDFNWSRPDGRNDYTFQVEVRNPGNCVEKEIEIAPGVKKTKPVCTYEVNTATNGIADDEPFPVTVEPNYYGFIQCMKETGALKDGKWVNDKIVATPFKQSFNGAQSSGNFDYYCYGPECKKEAGRPVKVTGGGCKTLESFKEPNGNKFIVYSKEEINRQKMEDEFQSICRNGDYKRLEQLLPAFKPYKDLYRIVLAARNSILENHVKLLKKEIVRNKKNLSKVDVNKYNEVLKEFYSKVIDPLKRRILVGADEIGSMPEGAARDEKQKWLNSLIARLRTYAQKDYLTNDEYNLMKSFAAKAPLDKEAWREAALTTYAITNTAYHLSRYNPDLRTKKNGLVDIDIESVQDLMETHQSDQAAQMEQLRILAEDKEGARSIAAGYEREARLVDYNYQQKLRNLQQDKQRIRQIAYQQCSGGNYGMTGLVQQSCFNQYSQMEQMMNYELQRLQSPQERNKVYDRMNEYSNLARQWQPIEQQRNAAFNIDPQVYQYNYQMTAMPGILRQPQFSNQMAQGYSQFMRNPYPVNPNSQFAGDYLRYVDNRNGYQNNQQAADYGRYYQQQALQQQYQNQYSNNGPYRNQYQFMNYNRGPASSAYMWSAPQQNFNTQGQFQWNFR